MIQTVDNYQSFGNDTDKYYFNLQKLISKDKKVIDKKLSITLEDYKNKSPNNTFFSFFKDKDKIDNKNKDDLIISIKKIQDNTNKDIYLAQTGNYIGRFVWNGLEIDIKSRFSNIFLERMLNFANDVFLDDVSVSGKETKDIDISKFIIYYMFIQKLEKAFLLGLPKSYRTIQHHDMKLKGKIDINRFIKYDIPFKGKISSSSREQKEIQEIIDVLHKAVSIIDKTEFSTKNISNIKTHLKQNRSNSYVSNETINKAIKSKALQNPIFAPYKKVLEYAKFIINGSNLEESAKKEKNETYGFLINVAELFEIYVTKLLQKEFNDWSVSSPQLRLDKEFGDCYLYNRKIIPDITMIHNESNKVMVFDTKYKKMKFSKQYGSGSDIDRCDFFQINTYMNYYHNQDRYNLIAGGLLYPIEEDQFDDRFNQDGKELNHSRQKAHSSSWFGNQKVKFIVDGINLSQLTNDNKITDFEEEFIKRIKDITT